MAMSYLLKSSSSATTERTLSLQEQQAKIKEVRELIHPKLSTAMPDFFSDASISRFLRARNWNAQRASKMLSEAARWRLEYKPETIRWEDVAYESETGKIYRTDYRDKCGRTVLVLRPGLQNTTSATGQIRHLVYCMENAVMNSTEQEQMVWLTDFQCWTLASTSVKVTRETARVLQDYYPERLGLAILYNPPRIFETFWKIVKPFLEHKTYEKVKFVYSDDLESQKIMADMFDMDKLDSSFGGRNPAGFDYNIYADRMRKDDKKMDALLSSNGGLLAHEATPEPDSDASSEACYYSGSESPKAEEIKSSSPKN